MSLFIIRRTKEHSTCTVYKNDRRELGGFCQARLVETKGLLVNSTAEAGGIGSRCLSCV